MGRLCVRLECSTLSLPPPIPIPEDQSQRARTGPLGRDAVRARDLNLSSSPRVPQGNDSTVHCRFSDLDDVLKPLGPERHCEAVARINERVHGRFHDPHRAAGFGEPLSTLQFELGTRLPNVTDPREDVARRQPQPQLVRVMEDHGVVGW